jgi:4Fe-4S binding protein
MKKEVKNILKLIISLLTITIFFIFLIPERVYYRLSFFLSNSYFYIVYASLIIVFILIILKKFKQIKLKPYLTKIIFGLIFLPAVFFPIMRCYFKVPYIFCKLCPKKCPWGNIRPFVIPSFLLLNLNSKFWCFRMCPIGTLQDYQCKVSKNKKCLPKWACNLKYFFLVLIIGLFFIQKKFSFFFKGDHHFYVWTFGVAIILFIISFFIPRFFCNVFCPIGSLSDLMLKLKKIFRKII